MPRQPAYAAISQNGTISEKTGSWCPIIALSSCRSSPVTPASAITGVPSAPNATGAVFAISESALASSGANPRPSRSAAVIATGVPKPAAPSKNAPNANATSSNCSRRSFVTPRMPSRSSAKCPRSCVSEYRKITWITIHPIGKKPYAAPRSELSTARRTGMPKTAHATTSAAASAASAAWCARTLCDASRPRRTSSGSAAASVESGALPSGS